MVGRTETVRHAVPESDWKVFRKLREVALERFCERVLDNVGRFQRDSSRTHHERYLDLYRWLQDRDDELARAFNDPRRSQMLWQLATIHSYGLLEASELAQLTPQTREAIASLARATGR